jgi:hypothetical protein
MSLIRCEFSITGAKTLIYVLDHVAKQADSTGSSSYAIDELCRRDSARRWRELRAYINSRIPKNSRVP